MKTLRFVYFHPVAQSVSLSSRDENNFNSSIEVEISSLTNEEQAAVGAALTWLSTTLSGGESVRKVILEPISDDPDHPKLNATVTGKSAAGERTIQITDAPPEVLGPLLTLWSALEERLNQ